MEMSVDGYDPIDNSRQQPADHLLADRFALLEGRVLPHVAEIGRHQNEPLRAIAPQCLGGEQERNELVVRPVERGIDDGRRGRWTDRYAQFSVRKLMQGNLVRGNAKPRCKSCCVASGGRQVLNGHIAHGCALLRSACGPSIR